MSAKLLSAQGNSPRGALSLAIQMSLQPLFGAVLRRTGDKEAGYCPMDTQEVEEVREDVPSENAAEAVAAVRFEARMTITASILTFLSVEALSTRLAPVLVSTGC